MDKTPDEARGSEREERDEHADAPRLDADDARDQADHGDRDDDDSADEPAGAELAEQPCETREARNDDREMLEPLRSSPECEALEIEEVRVAPGRIRAIRPQLC